MNASIPEFCDSGHRLGISTGDSTSLYHTPAQASGFALGSTERHKLGNKEIR